MTVFWTGQTICFGIHSETGSIAAGHAVVAMIFLYSAFCEYIFRQSVIMWLTKFLRRCAYL